VLFGWLFDLTAKNFAQPVLYVFTSQQVTTDAQFKILNLLNTNVFVRAVV